MKYKNKSLLDRTIESICSTKIENILVSTSSKKVISYLKKKHKKKVYIHHRDKNFKDSISSIEDILINSTKKFIQSKKINPDIIFFFSLHTIRFESNYVNTAIDLFKFNKFDTIYSVTKEQNPTFKFDGEKYSLLNRGRFKNLDYLSQKVVRFNGSFIGTWWKSLKNNQMFGKNFGVIEINDNDFLQINNLSRFFKKIKNLCFSNLEQKIKQKEIIIGIVGLGYVGLPLARTFCRNKIKVFGFDTDKNKISKLKKGISYINYFKNRDIKEMHKNFDCFSKFENISKCDAIILCLPTPIKK